MEQESDMDILIREFKDKCAVADAKKAEEKKVIRDERKARREAGDDGVSSDTDSKGSDFEELSAEE